MRGTRVRRSSTDRCGRLAEPPAPTGIARAHGRRRARSGRRRARRTRSTSTPIGWALTSVRRPSCSTIPASTSTSAARTSPADRGSCRASAVCGNRRRRWRASRREWRGAHRLGKDCPGVHVGPRDVHEVGEDRVGPGTSDKARRHVQVVVVEPDRRVGLCRELIENGLCKALVHGHIARPCLVQRGFVARARGRDPRGDAGRTRAWGLRRRCRTGRSHPGRGRRAVDGRRLRRDRRRRTILPPRPPRLGPRLSSRSRSR